MNLDGFQPTPIYSLSEKLYGNSFYIKRDDLFPVSFGGNKARKAVLFFREILKGAYNYVLTYGTATSNHIRAVANIAAANGIPCDLIMPQNICKDSFNFKMTKLLGANKITGPVVSEAIGQRMGELRAEGFKPYFIPGGGHGDIGTQAYVEAYEEINRYEKENDIYFDYIFLTSGTGTTQAGLVSGRIIHQEQREIIGISVARKNPNGREVVLDSVQRYLQSIGLQNVDIGEIHFIDDYVLEGYGALNKNILQTVREVLANEGIPLDTVYTGKCFWGMKDYICKNNIRCKNILFLHTGGSPLFFDYLRDLSYE